MRTSSLFGAKNLRFIGIYGVSVRTKGGGSGDCASADKEGEESIFAILCGRLYGRPLIKLEKQDFRNVFTSARYT